MQVKLIKKRAPLKNRLLGPYANKKERAQKRDKKRVQKVHTRSLLHTYGIKCNIPCTYD